MLSIIACPQIPHSVGMDTSFDWPPVVQQMQADYNAHWTPWMNMTTRGDVFSWSDVGIAYSICKGNGCVSGESASE